MRQVVPQLIAAGRNCRVNLEAVGQLGLRQEEMGFLRRSSVAVRLFDMVISVIALIAAMPLMLIAALAITVESRFAGPVFYRQTRVGRKGRLFQIVKFRTMVVDAEKHGAQWAATGDNRITPVGRFLRATRIDELPQFLNVLRGDMSVIGPRPERPEFTGELAQHIPHYGIRHEIKPGITGWAQVNYPYGSSVEDARKKLEYDLYYLQHGNFLMDLLIALKTIKVCVAGTGAR